MRRLLVTLVAAASAMGATACAADPADRAAPVSLDASAQRGFDIASEAGCMACHVTSEVGPAFAGLAGSTVTLVDGSTVVADRAHLAESITDPQAKVTAGFDIAMPTNQLTADEVDAVVDYLVAIGG